MDQRKPYVAPATRPATPEEIKRFNLLHPSKPDERCAECEAPVIQINGTRLATHEVTCSAQLRHDAEPSLSVSR